VGGMPASVDDASTLFDGRTDVVVCQTLCLAPKWDLGSCGLWSSAMTPRGVIAAAAPDCRCVAGKGPSRKYFQAPSG
jgi:hypothetical protein